MYVPSSCNAVVTYESFSKYQAVGIKDIEYESHRHKKLFSLQMCTLINLWRILPLWLRLGHPTQHATETGKSHDSADGKFCK